jgi:hypothetical protein
MMLQFAYPLDMIQTIYGRYISPCNNYKTHDDQDELGYQSWRGKAAPVFLVYVMKQQVANQHYTAL